jgi:hypothetical protein
LHGMSGMVRGHYFYDSFLAKIGRIKIKRRKIDVESWKKNTFEEKCQGDHLPFANIVQNLFFVDYPTQIAYPWQLE